MGALIVDEPSDDATDAAEAGPGAGPGADGDSSPERPAGGVLGLPWSAVDLAAGAVHVERALVRVGTDLVLGETKTAKSRRTRPLHPHLLAVLRRWRVEQAAVRLAVGPGWGDGWETDLVCTDPIGRPLTPDTLRPYLGDAWTPMRFGRHRARSVSMAPAGRLPR